MYSLYFKYQNDKHTYILNSNPIYPNNSFNQILNYDLICELSCLNNDLTSLPKLPSSIEILRCYDNHLTSLPELPNLLSVINRITKTS
jgi:hypothetical protein